MANTRIKKGDTIIMLSGKNKGKKGKVIKVFPEKMTIVVEGINVAKRHQKPMQKSPGGIIDKALPFAVSKAILVCPRCGKPTRISVTNIDGKNRRTCRKCKEIMDKV
ncbi:MAG: 50S ribosomal protein L24 [Candidatus Margulisbacteria bacterium]|nr:50S ribosomal protein L24 [Candidatus Margulisiibacteriota bacterium]MBU1616543.1 50S ribosomal protein L24 [Candidatus Margulisiibacteriota bacterium]MBU1866955.1 50S ribosomal protein L24 [Candidatus Margulisiibacteriota bacterium]